MKPYLAAVVNVASALLLVDVRTCSDPKCRQNEGKGMLWTAPPFGDRVAAICRHDAAAAYSHARDR